jgi:hypothetical protein
VFTAFTWTFRGDKVWLGTDKDLFSFCFYKFGSLQEVSLVTSLLLPTWFLSLQEVIKFHSNWGKLYVLTCFNPETN